jgi:hypothetical protein
MSTIPTTTSTTTRPGGKVKRTSRLRTRSLSALTAFFAAVATAGAAPALADAEAPDPFKRGPHTYTTFEPYVAGTVNLQEPSGTGGAVTGTSAAVTLQVRGSAYYPTDLTKPAPLVVLVHGNHTQCDFGTAPACTQYKQNERGYGYLAENLASWGYNVISISQDQMISYQDGTARGMHNRRMLIAATLDAFYAANQAPVPDGPNSNLGSRFVGKIDFSRIGMMGHSRGGDVVTSYLDYNRTRPSPGRRYDIRGVIALAPTDFERRAPYGSAFLAIQPLCDGDVTSQHGARMFERGQVVFPGDPFPKIQFAVNGANHNWFNTVWRTDGDDATATDAACGNPSTIASQSANTTTGRPAWANQDPTIAPTTTTIRLSGNAYSGAYTWEKRGSGDPTLMGDQQRIGLATMNSFFRRYVGGETAFDPYMTGELAAIDGGATFARNACPTSVVGMRIACDTRVLTNYYAGAGERQDVVGPEPDDPLTKTAVGTGLTASGFSNPYRSVDGILPVPDTTASGLDWCNPETPHYTASAIGFGTELLGWKACPQPGTGALGASTSTPVNASYGLQLAAAWDDPVTATGAPAKLSVRIPSARGDVTRFKALNMASAVNFFDARNGARPADAGWNPEAGTQDFTIALTDAKGKEGTVSAANARYGNALHSPLGSTNTRVHVILDEIRVPLADFAAQGVDLTKVRKLELRFGEEGKPLSGSVQLADIGFQEAADGPTVLAETPEPTGPASGPVAGPDPMSIILSTPRVAETAANPEPVGIDGALAPAAAAGKATPTCVDTTAPTSRVTARRTKGGKLILTGTARDAGCAGLSSVQVGLFQAAGKGKVRAVKPNGKLSRPVATAVAPSLVAKGKASWTLTVPKPASGTYTLVLKALDGSGNVQAASPRKITIR